MNIDDMDLEITSKEDQNSNDRRVERPNVDTVVSDSLRDDVSTFKDEKEYVDRSLDNYLHTSIPHSTENTSISAYRDGVEVIMEPDKVEKDANIDISPDELDGGNEFVRAGNEINNTEYIDDQDAEIANAFKQGNKRRLSFCN